jgi:hypothetical protein
VFIIIINGIPGGIGFHATRNSLLSIQIAYLTKRDGKEKLLDAVVFYLYLIEHSSLDCD